MSNAIVQNLQIFGAALIGVGIGWCFQRQQPPPAPKIVKVLVPRTDCPKLQEQWDAASAACKKHDGELRKNFANGPDYTTIEVIECQAQCTKDSAIPIPEIR